MLFRSLQLAQYTATLVSGQRMQVHLLHQVLSNDQSEVLAAYEPRLIEEVPLSEEARAAIKEGMLAVTQEGSVADYFQDLTVQVGAKTGSVQVAGKDEANAVFVCFAPYDDPEIAIAIVVEQGGSGSELGSIAAGIIAYYYGEAAAISQQLPPQEGEEDAQMEENASSSEIN